MSYERARILVVAGTRPEFIKLAPVVRELRSDAWCNVVLCTTGQHVELTAGLLDAFELEPDIALDIMIRGQTLNSLTARLLQQLDTVLTDVQPDMVLVQGDTTTTFATGLAAFHRGVPLAHVEAGLRTHNLRAPWPEEANRQLVSRLAVLHFPPTVLSRDNLLHEGIGPEAVFVTGNTAVDAVLHVREYVRAKPVEVPGLPPRWREEWKGRDIIVVTGHRRENFDGGLEAVCTAIVQLAEMYPSAVFIYPVHLNPNVRRAVDSVLAPAQSDNVLVIEALSYLPFVALMDAATLLLTDSGGIQEEAPSLKKPVLITRSVTERPEVVECGAGVLVGTETRRIVDTASRLLASAPAREQMLLVDNPVGDGRASRRISAVCRGFIQGRSLGAAREALHTVPTR